MALFKVIEVLSTENTDEGMLYQGRVLEENLPHRKADSLYLSYQGRRKGPRGLDPDHRLELRGNGNNEKHAVVEVELQVADRHEPGDYICVAIQVYDKKGNVEIIKNPTPTRVFRIVDEGQDEPTKKTEFLGWADVES